MHIHNRMRFAIAGALTALTLIGAGCGGTGKPGASAPTAGAPSAAPTADGGANAPTNSASADGGAITNWTTYRSESLGITVPYPEGWVVVSADSGGGIEFFAESPVENSESSSRVYLATSNRPATTEIDYPNRLSMTEESHSGVSMIKLSFLVDADFPTEVTTSYIWERGGTTYRLVGTDGDAVLLYMVDHLEVLP